MEARALDGWLETWINKRFGRMKDRESAGQGKFLSTRQSSKFSPTFPLNIALYKLKL